jgi:hypothetical protein
VSPVQANQIAHWSYSFVGNSAPSMIVARPDRALSMTYPR